MDIAGVVAPLLDAHLPNRLKERKRFNVTDGAANFDDADIGTRGTGLNRRFDFVGDMGNDLHRAAEVIATALFVDHALVNLAGREVVGFLHLH